ncbi:MAG TPA: iron-containing alcohol dehydrogenase [Pseudomonas xinjiangensis]|uniref:Iron-containing alcohol dehydrogenase n=2 Tax=root TaxID=1 RepID=A0A7V1FTU9_9GAMM|nr:iron-containing alcohol dehydrogenase [Halopseudomonas xinjiangensis]HEC47015.1 iron-containing alcohol dehydrogenase [Halopseudomonas xinjiangensis]
MEIKSYSMNWHYPTAVRVGAGRIRELAKSCGQLGMKAPLLVTDPGLAALPMVEEALQQCRDAGLRPGLFSGVKGNPTGGNVADGVTALKQGEHDGVIAFGGGSAIDAAKSIALIAHQTCTLWEAQNPANVDASKMLPLIAVPTTAGTGSEVGQAAVITDEETHAKRIIFHLKMMPPIVILDPELTVGLPAKLTAATGMDALAHNLEAYCTPVYHPMAEGIALEGIRLIKEYLPRATANGSDIEARLQMMVASSMGATAFQRGLGAIHAVSHSVGALYDSHHGLLNAIMMPYVLQANRSVIEEEMVRLGRYLGLEQANFDGVLQWVLALRKELDIPHTLADIGIDDSQAELVGKMSAKDVTARTNATQLDASQYQQLFMNALTGTL